MELITALILSLELIVAVRETIEKRSKKVKLEELKTENMKLHYERLVDLEQRLTEFLTHKQIGYQQKINGELMLERVEELQKKEKFIQVDSSLSSQELGHKIEEFVQDIDHIEKEIEPFLQTPAEDRSKGMLIKMRWEIIGNPNYFLSPPLYTQADMWSFVGLFYEDDGSLYILAITGESFDEIRARYLKESYIALPNNKEEWLRLMTEAIQKFKEHPSLYKDIAGVGGKGLLDRLEQADPLN